MALISGLISTVATAIAGWLAYQFLAKPLARFFDLRAATFGVLERYDNPFPGIEGGAAKQELLAAAMDLKSFVGSEPFISSLLGCVNIAPRSSALALENLSEYWGWEHTDYDRYRSQIREGLTFHLPLRRLKAGEW